MKLSIELANTALSKAETDNDLQLSAQIHTVLGKVHDSSNNAKEAELNFKKAISINKGLGDIERVLITSIDYVEFLLNRKRYDESGKIIDEILPMSLKHREPIPIAFTYNIAGDYYYKIKRFKDAVFHFKQALNFFPLNDLSIQDHLAYSYKRLAESHKRLKNREETAFFYRKALDVYTELGNKKLMARTANTLAEAERYLGNLVTALDYSLQSIEIHGQVDDPEGKAKALSGAGIIYRHIGRYEKSLEHIYQAYLYYKSINDITGIAKTSNQMGLLYTKLNEFEQAKSFYEVTIELPQDKIPPTTLASALREIAVIELNSKNFESAEKLASQALAIYQSEGDKLKASLVTRIIGNIYRAQIYYEEAILYYRESLKLAEEVGSLVYQAKALTPLANLILKKDADEAIVLLKKSLALSVEINDKSQILYAYRVLRKTEKKRQNLNQALAYAEKEIGLIQDIQEDAGNSKLALTKANLYSHKLEVELETLREKAKLDQLELAKKNNEIEIVGQNKRIAELELVKNKYASVTLALLLVVCLFAVAFIYRGFTNSKKRNVELHKLAARDELTNCYNRRSLFEQLECDFEKTNLPERYCIIMADIDHFKNINDTHGHSTGDAVIKGVAQILRDCLRQNDIVARYGGEEFCIVLPLTTKERASHIAKKMLSKIEKTQLEGISVTCSFGISSIKDGAKTPTELIDQADSALYKSKQLGRNQINFWEKIENE
ncbi:diguanylate cyclase [Alteromonas sp. 5E99-2]|nr:diguanylate cyclase [Alteromonas sp. 5E99-2]